MTLNVRPMALEETDLIIDYFHSSTRERLELMGVDPTRLQTPSAWRERYKRLFETPIEGRDNFQTIWLDDERPIGLSSASDIVFGDQAKMHLHVINPSHRNSGIGARCVRLSVDIYFETLKLRRLFSEPNAFNVAPNRTLQKAGFRYVKTHMTVPGPMNHHQAVTRWVFER
jgi:RimJ/RimL family protein N-acetyltransferase